MRSSTLILLTALWSWLAPFSAQAEPIELIMVDEAGCHWCARWTAEIGPIYPKTEEGRIAPLRRIDISERRPAGVTYTKKVIYTPTFVLLSAGQEVARIEGYPGEDFFWGLLKKLLVDHDMMTEGAS